MSESMKCTLDDLRFELRAWDANTVDEQGQPLDYVRTDIDDEYRYSCDNCLEVFEEWDEAREHLNERIAGVASEVTR
jgi:hypothetical protein